MVLRLEVLVEQAAGTEEPGLHLLPQPREALQLTLGFLLLPLRGRGRLGDQPLGLRPGRTDGFGGLLGGPGADLLRLLLGQPQDPLHPLTEVGAGLPVPGPQLGAHPLQLILGGRGTLLRRAQRLLGGRELGAQEAQPFVDLPGVVPPPHEVERRVRVVGQIHLSPAFRRGTPNERTRPGARFGS